MSRRIVVVAEREVNCYPNRYASTWPSGVKGDVRLDFDRWGVGFDLQPEVARAIAAALIAAADEVEA